MLLILTAWALPASAGVKILSATWNARVMGMGTDVSLTVVTPATQAATPCAIEIWPHLISEDEEGDEDWSYPQILPTMGKTIMVGPGTNTFHFLCSLKPGTYTERKGKLVLLYDGGSATGSITCDTAPFRINWSQVVQSKLEIWRGRPTVNPDGTISVPWELRWPTYAPHPAAVTVRCSGSGGSASAYCAYATSIPAEHPYDPYRVHRGLFTTRPTSAPPRLYGLSYAAYDGTVKVATGKSVEVEIGDWVAHSNPADWTTYDEALRPDGKAPWSIGGCYGNQWAWTTSPLWNDVNYFRSLRAAGFKWLRLSYAENTAVLKPRRASIYRHRVEACVEKMLAAGLMVIVAPQDLPNQPGETLAERSEHLVELAARMADVHAGKPVIIDLLNEPYAYGQSSTDATWASYKPVMERAAAQVKGIDPGLKVLCPFPAWSHDGRPVARSPISPHLVDFYGWHPYSPSTDITAERAAAPLPVILEESRSTDPMWHVRLEQLGGTLGNVKGAAQWAWTTYGQDALPLIDRVFADGSAWPNATGQVLLDYYDRIRRTGTVYVPGETYSLRVNCGGPAWLQSTGQYWRDTGAKGGKPYEYKRLVADDPDGPILRTGRSAGPFTYTLTPTITNITHTLRLHFYEGKCTAPGQRKFDVLLNGKLIVDDLDIVARVGPNKHLVLEFPVSGPWPAVLSFPSSSSIVSAIELIPGGGPPPPPPPPDPPVAVRVNAGAATDWTDPSAVLWGKDAKFSGGSTKTYAQVVTPDPWGSLYRTIRYGSAFQYTLPAAPGNYTLRAYFYEGYESAAGRRRIRVKVDGATWLSALDIFAEAGKNRPLVKSIDLTLSGPTTVRFESVTGTPIVSGLELVPR